MATEPAGDACPHCGAGEELMAGPARVTLRKRDLPADAVARVGPGDEAAALRDSLAWHQTGMAGLQEELEAERGAAAEAASEAMSMILRLQRDKSEAMMEARQFRRFAEDRFAHDAAELAALHDAIARRDASIQSLSAQLRACRSRLLQLGFLSPSSLPSSPTAAAAAPGDHPFADDDYPSIHCLDQPAAPSDDDDDCCDRVYTVDAVHAAPEDRRYFPTPMETNLGSLVPAWTEEQEIHKLSARLQALEADRESMRHAIMSMGPDKAQALMLNDIAHHLCDDDDEAPLNALSFKMHPDRKVVKNQPFAAKFFLVTVIKWITSVFIRGRKLDRIKYPIGLCGSYVGLMLLLDRSHKQRYRKYLKRS
ncbi:myosin-binding protein 7 isoform X2 [Lolium perenne]|uniref:myosin-binding protein 7 isoform X2 n=1 Tax=Lolium perenne TaxID=4522 RepID=UPI0021F6076C|nr:myosin-binding protein 7-like isoform X2 [Lolium perenne]